MQWPVKPERRLKSGRGNGKKNTKIENKNHHFTKMNSQK